jgi:hypothetical protein
MCKLARLSLSSDAVPGGTLGYEPAALLDSLLEGQRQPLLVPLADVVTGSQD